MAMAIKLEIHVYCHLLGLLLHGDRSSHIMRGGKKTWACSVTVALLSRTTRFDSARTRTHLSLFRIAYVFLEHDGVSTCGNMTLSFSWIGFLHCQQDAKPVGNKYEIGSGFAMEFCRKASHPIRARSEADR